MRTQYSFGIMGYNGTTTKVEISITNFFFSWTLIVLKNIMGTFLAFFCFDNVLNSCFLCVVLVDWQLYIRRQQHYDTGDQADAESGPKPR